MAGNIREWLTALELDHLTPVFNESQIGLRDLPLLSEDDLKELGLQLGPRRRVLNAIANIKPVGTASAAEKQKPEHQLHLEAERRQLTVMFCDLVGSTALSERLDPEDMRDILRTYQNSVSGEVARFEGHVAKFMGDGVLAYFGWPAAHEDDAERAVRAGLAITGSVERLAAPTGERLATRIGIATGIVVVGDLAGEGAAQEEAVVGDTPNLAARLQDIAKPGTVIIAPSTQHLLADLFELQDLGRHKLKGIGAPVQAWRVAAERAAESRFDVVHGRALTPFVGREQEVSLILDRWRRAKEGEGQVVLLSGEAGVGKSRIVEALKDGLADEPHIRLRNQCSPHHTNSALYPVINQLMFAAGFGLEDTTDQKFDKLDTLLAPATGEIADVTPLIADLLSLPFGNRYAPLEFSPERQKEKTLTALFDQLTILTARQPVLLVYEDVHWIDPTTQELIDLVIGRIGTLRVLLVITHRPEFQSDWARHAHATTLSLNRLGRRDCLTMVERLTLGKRLPEDVRDEIVAKTDGVPLFVEELTKTVLESGLLDVKGDHYALSGALPPLAIPATLQDSLMARLDRLASVKDVAQIGAAIGREFSHELLAAVAQIGDGELDDALHKIMAAELVFRRGTPPRADYTFKHALVQDAAYESMLRSRRQELHARIAQALKERFPEQAETVPEILAHHYTEAGLAEPAVENWLRAGRRASERSANKEALGHLSMGLRVLEQLTDEAARKESELALLVALGPVLRATKGYADSELERTYARARELCLELGDKRQLFPILVGLSFCFLVRGQYRSARDQGEQCLEIARQDGDQDGMIGAHRAIGTAAYWHGDFASAQEHLRGAISLYDPARHDSHVLHYGYDPQITCLAYLSSTLWLLGFPEQALTACHEALDLARRRDHPYSLAMALGWIAWMYLHLRNRQQVMVYAEELKTLSTEQGYPHWKAFASSEIGWALVHGPDAVGDRVEQMRQDAADWRSAQGLLAYAWLLNNLAEEYLRVRQHLPGLQVVEEALSLAEDSDGLHVEPEFIRLKGELLLIAPNASEEEVETCFRQAIEVARRQQAKSWELRATMSLARLWQSQGKVGEARDLLVPVYNWFSEGFDTLDLKDAKALLDELA